MKTTLYIAALIFACFGLFTMYHYGEESKIVGGDSYNFIILGLRGIGWIMIGAILAIIGAGHHKCVDKKI